MEDTPTEAPPSASRDVPGHGASRGLSAAEVEAARARHGWNEVPRAKGPGPVRIFLRQFRGLLILILAVAAVIALVLGERVDALAITLVLLLNAVLGFVQEWRAETALEAMRSMLSPEALVIRDGEEQVIPAREIVPGDLVVVAAGEIIPADLALRQAIGVRADEAVLTGESVPADKTVGGPDGAGMLYAGSTLAAGRAEGVVTATGLATAFGEIARLTGERGEKLTNLQRRLGQLARQLGAASILIAGGVVAIGLLVGRPLNEMFMTGLSLAVAMVPEGLPAVVTVTLALGAAAMVRRRALVRRLQAVETLGAASVICTDKTGTLTENEMTATRIWTRAGGYEVTGRGYDPTGHIEADGARVRAAGDPVLAALLDCALTCTHAHLRRGGAGWEMIGEPTEGALVTLAYKGWAPLPAPDANLAEKPFTSERKMMSVLARAAEDGFTLHVKGAPEAVLALCTHAMTSEGPTPLTDATRAEAQAAFEDMAADGERVLALASRPAGPDDLEETGLTLLGLVGMIDPPRPEVAPAIREAHAAGIRVLMITGDGAGTAQAVAREIGLPAADTIEGTEIDAFNDETLADRLSGEVLFARTRPEHKLRIVSSLQAGGQIVAMTGDGVNDAPALKRADIGIAMGQRGTDVSRDTADLVLLDDNFATIVGAIAEGRRQFENLRKFVRYLLASNAGEVVAIVTNLAIGGPLVFLATQILWMNLITDSVTAAALGLERGEREQMERPPRKPDAPIIGLRGAALIALFGLYTGAASLWVFYSLLPLGTDIARTTAFSAMVAFEMVSVFAFRSLTQPTWAVGWFSNPLLLGALTLSLAIQAAAVYWPPLQALLRTVPIPAEHWLLIAALSLPLIAVPEMLKTLWRWRVRRPAT